MKNSRNPDERERPSSSVPGEGNEYQTTNGRATDRVSGAGGKPRDEKRRTGRASKKRVAGRARARREARRRRLRDLRDIVIRAALLALVVYVLFFHLVGVTIMPTGDMYPRIDAGDLLLFYRLDKDIRAQDVIVFEKPVSSLNMPGEEQTDEQTDRQADTDSWYWRAARWLGFRNPNAEETRLFVCRVVAAVGDSVQIGEDGRLIVNGSTMIENNIFFNGAAYPGFLEYPVVLGPGEFFALADMRNGGTDSRVFGPVRQEEILGTVITIVRRNNL